MRTVLLGLIVVGAILFAVAQAGAAEQALPAGQIPSDTLAAMGLGSLQPISDAEGLQIRGRGRSSGVICLNVYKVIGDPALVQIASPKQIILVNNRKCPTCR